MAKRKMIPHAGLDKDKNTYSRGGKKTSSRKYACGGRIKKK